jgi:hypothetical protein
MPPPAPPAPEKILCNLESIFDRASNSAKFTIPLPFLLPTSARKSENYKRKQKQQKRSSEWEQVTLEMRNATKAFSKANQRGGTLKETGKAHFRVSHENWGKKSE